jgi:hypothetical protein
MRTAILPNSMGVSGKKTKGRILPAMAAISKATSIAMLLGGRQRSKIVMPFLRKQHRGNHPAFF